MTRHENKGLRKLCEHPRRGWAKCACPWHFNFKWKDRHYRFSLDKHLDKHLDSKSEAEDEAAKIRIAIKAGKFGQTAPREEMTLRQLCDLYQQRYVDVQRSTTAGDFKSGLRVICATALPRPTGGTVPFGDWRLTDIVVDTVERYREARRAKGTGVGGTNRSLSRLRAVFGWAIRTGYMDHTPFKRHTETVIKLSRETPRSRRLNADLDEDTKLLAACDPHLRSVVECALATGMRRGEILSLQWREIVGMTVEEKDGSPTSGCCSRVVWAPKAEIVLLATKTKTKRDRRIPISTRLRGILELRRFDPAGQLHELDAYVFGNGLGQRVQSTKRAWMTAVLKAHGEKPSYTTTMNLTPESRAKLQAINLHFHDLRREAGSRWLDGGVPLHTVRDWLGHTNISQTSTYLSGTQQTQHDAMKAYETALQQIATEAGKGGQTRPRSAAGRKEKASKTAVGRGSAIM
jgi:integrase